MSFLVVERKFDNPFQPAFVILMHDIQAHLSCPEFTVHFLQNSKIQAFEGLYLAVLEKVYGELRTAEMSLDVVHEDHKSGLKRIIELTFDYQEAHPEFVRLVNTESVNNGRYIEQSETILSLNITIIDVLIPT